MQRPSPTHVSPQPATLQSEIGIGLRTKTVTNSIFAPEGPSDVARGGSPWEPSWSARALTAFRRRLLAWFDDRRRDLPWRENRDPYRVWVSEVMLQQTTVAAVVPYFNRFVEAFPTVQALAEADEQHVLAHWQGLGYYRRARHLHAAAKFLAEYHPDGLPDDPAVWEALPGVGRYILGAVLSQAFDRRLPVVEANTLRVLSRLFGSRLDPREGDGKKWVWEAAEAVLPRKRVGDFNQAMMELGALVCTPANPRCGACPARTVCVAKRDGTQAEIPPKPREKPRVAVAEVTVAVWDGPRVLLCRRPPTATRWANMWELPRGEVAVGEDATAAAARVVKELAGLDVEIGTEVLTLRHGVTRFDITLTCLEATVTGGEFASAFYTSGDWLTPAEWTDRPASTPQRRLLAELANPNRARRLF